MYNQTAQISKQEKLLLIVVNPPMYTCNAYRVVNIINPTYTVHIIRSINRSLITILFFADEQPAVSSDVSRTINAYR